MKIDGERLRSELLKLLKEKFPEMTIEVNCTGERPLITFIDPSFEGLYPEQRYHRLVHQLPKEVLEEQLADCEWKELSPGEDPNSIDLPDVQLIGDISGDVLAVVSRTEFYKRLDSAFLNGGECTGVFDISKKLLIEAGFDRVEIDDILHVFMSRGGFCDCEILYNVADQSEVRARYWKAEAGRLL